MGLQQAAWGVTVLIFVFCKGCHSQPPPACGVATLNSRIVGGQDAVPGSWPWHAALNISGNVSCGGSLISNEWVLTAAHCITRDDLNLTMVHLGLQNVSGSNPNEVIRELDDIVCHFAYNYTTNENDICLLKLSAPVTFTTSIQPICLASADSTFYNGTSSWVIGFGATDDFGSVPDTLQEVNVPIIGHRQCQCYHHPLNITKNMICAGHPAGGRDSCQGDSGGPLMSRNGSVWVQSGVVSWGVGCAEPMSPGVYTRVSRYHEWIDDTVTGMRPGFVTFMSPGPDSDLYFNCPSMPPPFSTTRYPPYTTHYPPYTTHYPPYTTHYPPYTTHIQPPRTGGPPCPDIFCDAGENLIHFTHFVTLSVLALVLHVFVGSG